jgi:hypothetical protein
MSTPHDKQWLQDMCEIVKQKTPEGYGFIVFAFPYVSGERMYYASSGQREDCIRALKSWLSQVDGGKWATHE